METMRDSWTDERLDDLSDRMDRGFELAREERLAIRADMDRGFAQARAEQRELRADMDRGFEWTRAEQRELRSGMERRFDSLQQALFLAAAGVIAALIGLIATQL
jgi:predicted phage gp36 major capsid-like protein